jgi:hypothetical protein
VTADPPRAPGPPDAPDAATGLVHVDLRPFACLLRREHVMNLEEGHGEFLPCTVFGLSSYAGHAPTFSVLVEDRFLYTYVPVHALAGQACEPLALHESAYFDCPDEVVTVVYHRHLLELGRCRVYRRDGSPWSTGTYLCTLDWYRADHALHLVRLDGGPFLLWPNHRLAFSDAGPALPGFRRSRQTWRVAE